MDTKEVTYSEAIYLFADKVIPERSKFLTYDRHPTDEKISAKPLSYQMVFSALIYLLEKKYITLCVKDVKILFLFPGKAVFGKQMKGAGQETTGIEKKLLDNFKEETTVEKAVYHILDDDETSPWGQVVVASKNSLVEKGFLEIEKERKNIFSSKRYLFSSISKETVKSVYEEAIKKIHEFELGGDLAKLSRNAVKKGIDSRLEQTTSED